MPNSFFFSFSSADRARPDAVRLSGRYGFVYNVNSKHLKADLHLNADHTFEWSVVMQRGPASPLVREFAEGRWVTHGPLVVLLPSATARATITPDLDPELRLLYEDTELVLINPTGKRSFIRHRRLLA